MLKATSCREPRAPIPDTTAGRGHGSEGGAGGNSLKMRPHSSPVKLLKTAMAAARTQQLRGLTPNTGPHEPFRYRGTMGDEDEEGAVALKGNLGGAPRGVWVQQTVHRLEPGQQRKEGSESQPRKTVDSVCQRVRPSLTLMDPPPQ